MNISIMINEEDHLRIQVLSAGFDIDNLMNFAIEIDEKLSKNLDYAYSEKYGFLTACPTNVGTGLRASVMVHLPALTKTGNIQKILEVINNLGMNIRGVYGEGTKAYGDMYQVSNKISLGITNKEIITNVKSIANKLIEQERNAREFLKSKGVDFEDRILADGLVKNVSIRGLPKKKNTNEASKQIPICREQKT